MRLIRLALVTCGLLGTLSAGASDPPKTRLLESEAELSIALIPATSSPVPEAAVRKALTAFTAKKQAAVEVETMGREDYPGLSADLIEHLSGLSEAGRKQVERAPKVVSVVIHWPRTQTARLREAYQAVAALAEKHQALIFDRDALVAFTLKDWRSRRIDEGWTGPLPMGPMHFQVHMVGQDNGLVMLDTGGMPRFGVSDFELLDVNRASLEVAASLVSCVAQRLIEGAEPDSRGHLTISLDQLKQPEVKSMMRAYPNAKRSVVVGFTQADVSLGGREDALELTFPKVKCANRGECLDAALKQLFGWEDEVTYLDHDAKVNDARARALAALARYEAKVKKGLPPGEVLLVKARFPFEDGDRTGNEWMWVDVVSWSGKLIRGRLENEPHYVKTVKSGATVEVKLEDVMDYIHQLNDGTFYGNEVGKVTRPELFEELGGGRARRRE